MRRVSSFAGGILLLSMAAPGVAQTSSYGPPAPAPRAQPTVQAAAPAVLQERRTSNVRRPFVGAESPAMRMGVGMFKVPKSNDNDPNRNFPMREVSGRTQGIAAVGASFRF